MPPLPELQVMPFVPEGMMRVDCRNKYGVQSVPCFFLKNGDNHLSSAAKLLKAPTNKVCYTIDVVWTVLCTRTLPAPARGEGVNGRLRARVGRHPQINH